MNYAQLYFSFVDWKISEGREPFTTFFYPIIKQVIERTDGFTINSLFADFPSEDLDEKYSIPITVVVGSKNQSYFPFMRVLEERRWAFLNCPVVFDYEINK